MTCSIPLLEPSHDQMYEREIVTAIAVASVGGAHRANVGAWRDRLKALVGDDSTGSSELIQWMALSWMGDVPTAVADRSASVRGPTAEPGHTRPPLGSRPPTASVSPKRQTRTVDSRSVRSKRPDEPTSV